MVRSWYAFQASFDTILYHELHVWEPDSVPHEPFHGTDPHLSDTTRVSWQLPGYNHNLVTPADGLDTKLNQLDMLV